MPSDAILEGEFQDLDRSTAPKAASLGVRPGCVALLFELPLSG